MNVPTNWFGQTVIFKSQTGELLAVCHRYVDQNGIAIRALDPKRLLDQGVVLVVDPNPKHVCPHCQHMPPAERYR